MSPTHRTRSFPVDANDLTRRMTAYQQELNDDGYRWDDDYRWNDDDTTLWDDVTDTPCPIRYSTATEIMSPRPDGMRIYTNLRHSALLLLFLCLILGQSRLFRSGTTFLSSS